MRSRIRRGPLRASHLAHPDTAILLHLSSKVFGQPGWSEAWRRPEGGALGGTEAGLAKHGRDPVVPAPVAHFFLLSIVRRKRKDSAPVSMICARSVIRSNSALHKRGFGNTVVHSENGRFVVTMSAALSARSEIT